MAKSKVRKKKKRNISVPEKKAWREFELLVARCEKVLLSSGAKVQSPDHIPDVVTGTLREVDASIRFKNGSTEYLSVLECRDRSKVQDVLWIEQLSAKKSNLAIDKMIAVSAKGFSAEAKAKAKQLGINTHTLKRIDDSVIQGWKQIVTSVHIDYVILNYEFLTVKVAPVGKEVKTKATDSNIFDEDFFYNATSLEKISVRNILNEIISKICEERMSKGLNYKLTFNLKLISKSKSLLLIIGANCLQVDEIDVKIEVKNIERKNVEASGNFIYSDPVNDILRVVDFEIENAKGKHRLSFHQVVETGELKIQFERL